MLELLFSSLGWGSNIETRSYFGVLGNFYSDHLQGGAEKLFQKQTSAC